MRLTLISAIAACALFAMPAQAQTIKIGAVLTLTTGAAVIGNDMRDAYDLALETIGNKMGDFTVEMIYADDELNVDKGKAATEQLVLQDGVDIVTGHIWSNILIASTPVVLEGDASVLGAPPHGDVHARDDLDPGENDAS